MKNILVILILFLFVFIYQPAVTAADDIYENLINSGNYNKVEKIKANASRNYFYKTTKNNKYGAVDNYGYFVIGTVYDDVKLSVEDTRDYYPGEIFVVTDSNKKGAYRRKETFYIQAVPIQFDDVRLLARNSSEYYIEVTLNNKKGVFISTDRSVGLVKLPIVFDEITVPDKHSIIVKQFGKYGAFDWDRQIVPIIYDKIEPSGRSMIVTQNNQQGAYHDGVLVVPIGYDEVREADTIISFIDLDVPKYIVKKNNKYGVYGLIPNEFDSIETVHRGFITEKNGKYGLYHLTKGKLFNSEFDKIYSTSNTDVACEKNGKIVKEIDMSMQSARENVEEGIIKTMFFPLFWATQGLH